MLNYKAIFALLLLTCHNLQFSISALTGQCNECFASGIACLAEQTFVRCSDSTPTTMSTPCPIGTVCTAENNICVDTLQGAVPVCYEDAASTIGSETGTTTSQTTESTPFATSPASTETTTQSVTTESITKTSTTESPAATTPDTTTPTTTKETTETSTEIKPETTTSKTTLDTTTVAAVTSPSPTTTTIAPIDANSLCAKISKKGNFRLEGDKTCSRYIYCYLLGGQYLGWEYTCSQYFNAATAKCQQTRPADC